VVALDEFSRLVAGIYRAAVSPGQWQGAIRDVQRALDGKGGALLIRSESIWSWEDSTLPAPTLDSYTRHYHKLDYAIAAVAHGPAGAVRTGREILVPNRNWEFYTDWMRANEIEDALFVRLTVGLEPACFVIASAKPDFDTADRVQLMGRLVPHLQQALSTHSQMADLADQTRDLAAALELTGRGVIIVGSQGQALTLNLTAESILRAQDGLLYRSGRVIAGASRAHRELHCALRDALTDDGSDVRRGHTFTCARPSAKRSYVIHVLPLHGRPTDAAARGPSAMILIIDPEREPESVPTMLQRLYSLTASEAQVALRISQGLPLKEIAEELSVSYQTVRTHLQHIFDKTDTHRQGELIRLLLALNP
jgi:DNA-binding CsgD family transcriptional regulator